MPDFEIVDKGGIDPLVASIGVELKAPGRQAVGIIVDANNDIETRWSAVKNRVSRAGIALGDRDPNGTIARGGGLEPDVGVWIMPDKRSPGELEDFIADMIPKDDSVWPLSRAYIDGIPAESRLFNPKKEKRAKVHAWLAARERPRPMGMADWGGGSGSGTGPLHPTGHLASAAVWTASRPVSSSPGSTSTGRRVGDLKEVVTRAIDWDRRNPIRSKVAWPVNSGCH